MYRLSSLNRWYDGMRFDNLAAAKAKCDQAAEKGIVCDVLRDRDKSSFQMIYSGKSGHLPAFQGTYAK